MMMGGRPTVTTAIFLGVVMELKKPHIDWLADRGIDPTLAQKFGLHTVQREGRHWLTVPYLELGSPVNHKYRVVSEKHNYRMDDNAPLTLWNYDVIQDQSLAHQPLIITEGEWDALTILSCGKSRVVSVPNGAPGRKSDDEQLADGKRYQWFWRCEAALREVSKVVLCVDADEQGQALAADLCRLFGPERCMFVTYPEGCKDAGDVWLAFGPDAVVRLIDNAKPYPIKGLYDITDFPEKGDVVALPVGIPAINDMIYIVPGTLTVFTGYANMGKSSLVNVIAGNLIRHNVPICIASFETEVKPILHNALRCAVAGCGEHDLKNQNLSEIDAAIVDNVRIISQLTDEDDEMDLDYFLDLCRTAVIRDGVKMIVLDPWNELEHKRRRDETETDYISRALRAIKRFAKQYQVAFWIVAHPTKPQEGKPKVPGLYDISGSANWANKADYGLTYHRPKPDQNMAEVRITKVRMGLPGKRGSVFVTYDFRCAQFRLADAA